MARNGSGTYSRVPGSAYTNGTTADGSELDAEFNDLATEITGSLAKNGETVPTANLPMATYRHTGVGAATVRTDYARAGESQDSVYQWLTSVAGTNTITATGAISVSAYATGQTFRFATAGANTGAVTININSIGAKAITKNGTTALVSGDLVSGAVYELTYDGTQFQLQSNPAISTGFTSTGDIVLSGNASIEEARANITQHATTMDFWAGPNVLDGAGSAVTITACVNAPQAGARRKFYPLVSTALTHGATFDIDGNANQTAAAGDCWEIVAKTTSTYKVHVTKDDGTAVVATSTNQAYIYIRDEKASGTGGGTFTNGAWRTRTLNTEVADTGNNATLATDQITLLAGTYQFVAKAPAFGVDRHRVRLQNITDATTIATGSSEHSSSAYDGDSSSFVRGRFTLAASKALELQHYCLTTAATNGFGISAGAGGGGVVEVYAEIEFWKEV